MVALLLSFPAYLVIAGNTNFWRTQMLSGFGAALTLTACALLVASLTRRPLLGQGVSVVLAGAVVFFGVRAGERIGGVHAHGWEQHRAIMWQVVNLVPGVDNDALIMVVGVPRDKDPIGDPQWFDFPVRLSYQGHTVAGGIAYADPGPTDHYWEFGEAGLRWNELGNPPPPQLRAVSYDHLILLGYDVNGVLTVLDRVPDWLTGAEVDDAYDPTRLIVSGGVTDMNRRRFGQ
jgi:hypothetical protein